MKTKINFSRIALLGAAGLVLLGMSSCLPLAAGAAVGYVAHDEGYRLRNPIKKVE
ncbi:MAG: hypothetical protein H7Y36_01100 [Armatimonadetes bacterium]|nr:hypothetical protein [Akkermansiaceae bacterium]